MEATLKDLLRNQQAWGAECYKQESLMREKHAVNLKKKQVSLGVGSCEVAPLIQCV